MTKRRIWIACVCAVLALAVVGGVVYLLAVHLPQKREAEEWRRAMQAYYDAKVAQYTEENKQYKQGEVDVVFLGDSLTDGYDLAAHYPQYVTLNRGIGGDTAFGLEKRLQVSVYDVQPGVAVMLIGANNVHTMMDNYECILQGFAEHLPDTEIVLLSLTSMGGSWADRNEKAAYNNARIKGLAAQYGYTFVDLYTPLLNPQTGEIREEYTTDGGHLTPAGYNVLTVAITPALAAHLGY